MGRFSVDFVMANNPDVLNAKPGDRVPDSIPHVSGRVGSSIPLPRGWCCRASSIRN